MKGLRTFGEQIQNAFAVYGIEDTRVEFEYIRDKTDVTPKNPRGLGQITGARCMIVRRKDTNKPWTRDNVRVVLRASRRTPEANKLQLRLELWRQLWNDYKSRQGYGPENRQIVRDARNQAKIKVQVLPAQTQENVVQVHRT